MKYVKLFLLVAVALFAVNAVAFAESAAHRERINLEFHASKYFNIDKKIERVFVGSQEIIKVAQPSDSPNEFVISAQDKKGSTTLFVWTADGARYEYLVNVTDEEIGQAELIEEAIGLPNVHVKKVDKKILLTGTVKNQYERNYALQTARLYVSRSSKNNLSVGSNVSMDLATTSSKNETETTTLKPTEVEDSGDIIDLLTMTNPIQIRLESQVIEIDSDAAKDLGIEYSATGGDFSNGKFNLGEDYNRNSTTTTTTYYNGYFDDDGVFNTRTISFSDSDTSVIPFNVKPLKWIERRFAPINASIHALVSNGKARILSRPSVTTMSAEQATIQIGGQIPYTIQTNDGPNTEWKDYGIILQMKPIVDAENRIISAIHTEVSSLSTTSGGDTTILTRRADTIMTLTSGSTMVVGGLMDSSESKNIRKIPLLGDIPILGEFFKYTSKTRDKRELIILVTPHIVEMGTNTPARMSDTMRDVYYEGQREQNDLNDVDLNKLPPPFEDDKDKKKKSKKDKKANAKKDTAKVEISDYPPENTNKETPNKTNDENVEVFGDNY